MRIDAGACGYIADGSPGRPQTIGTNPHPPASIRTDFGKIISAN